MKQSTLRNLGDPNGTIEFTDKDGNDVRLTPLDAPSYVRASTRIGEIAQGAAANRHRREIYENDVALLQKEIDAGTVQFADVIPPKAPECQYWPDDFTLPMETIPWEPALSEVHPKRDRVSPSIGGLGPQATGRPQGADPNDVLARIMQMLQAIMATAPLALVPLHDIIAMVHGPMVDKGAAPSQAKP